MLLIADSGSTKTDWVLLKGSGETQNIKTIGFNPYFVDTAQVYDVLREEFSEQIDLSLVSRVYFYGAGCSSDSKKAVINNALKQLFPEAKTVVDHDLMGAARALLGNDKGIAGILGTGSNSCLYDGKQVVESLFSLGYMFGDEGSGAHLGKTYVKLHLKKKVPVEIREQFEKKTGLSPEDILTHVYKKPNPNRFLASFSVFLKKNIDHPFIEDIVENCFDEYFREQVCQYTGFQDIPFSFIGSVGYNFSTQLQRVASKYGVTTGRYLVSPMEGLIDFHTRDNNQDGLSLRFFGV